LFVHNSLKATVCTEFDYINFQDSVWCWVSLVGKGKVSTGVVYRSPIGDQDNNNHLIRMIQDALLKVSATKLFIMGDFNLPETDYDTLLVHGEDSSYQLTT
jgi:hypothetical protein